MDFPNHVSFTLEHNPQNVLHLTVDDFLANQKAIDEMTGFCDSPNFESEDHRVLSVISNELWTLHYYPGNSVAIYLAAPSLDELLAFAKRRKVSDG